MKLPAAFGLLEDIYLSLTFALWPTLQAVWRDPRLLLRPLEIRRIYMAHLWVPFGDGVDENGRSAKVQLIPENAKGVVFDIGAGHGHTVDYLQREQVTKYIALEPNTLMHARIRERAEAKGYKEADGSFLLLPYGAENYAAISKHVPPHSVNTMIDILSLCSLPEKPHPRLVLKTLVEGLLAPGGIFVFYEHVLSHRKDVAWWQRVWAPIWQHIFDGCRLDRPTHIWVEQLGPEVWREGRIWGKTDEPEENLFWHQMGRFVKK